VTEPDAGWTDQILERLHQWQAWADATSELHHDRTRSLARRVRLLAASAVVLSVGGAIWLTAVPGRAEVAWIVGALTTGAAAAASGLYTFLRYGEKAEEHRQMAERWFALRRELSEILTLHPEYLRNRLDPEFYIAELRTRIEDESARSRSIIESGGWREIAAQQRLEFRAATIAAAGRRPKGLRPRRDESPSLFTDPVRDLLADWERRAAASSDAHAVVAQRLARLNVSFGVPAVLLLATDAASLLMLRSDARASVRLALGILSVLAAVLVALNAYLRTTEWAARHSIAAELWARLRGEIGDVLRSPPRRVQADPKAYLDDLRREMDQLSAISPEVGEHAWTRALADGTGGRMGSATDATKRFTSVFPGINLRVEDEAV
jgi:hypothetical protein